MVNETDPAPGPMRWQCYCDNCQKVIETKDAYQVRDMTLCRVCFETHAEGKEKYITFLEMLIGNIWADHFDGEEMSADEIHAELMKLFEEWKESTPCPTP